MRKIAREIVKTTLFLYWTARGQLLLSEGSLSGFPVIDKSKGINIICSKV